MQAGRKDNMIIAVRMWHTVLVFFGGAAVVLPSESRYDDTVRMMLGLHTTLWKSQNQRGQNTPSSLGFWAPFVHF